MALSSDLFIRNDDGTLRLPAEVHPLPNLLEMQPEEILRWFTHSQRKDFEAAIARMTAKHHPLKGALGFAHLSAEEGERLARRITPERLAGLFRELHDHVMDHPVWRHPFFLRIFRAEFTLPQARLFATHYFNQIKNTRQCVALACGRFSSLTPPPFGILSERASELTQIVLAQLLADEYGVGTASLEEYPELERIFNSTTHIVMYRWLLEGLEVPFGEQDVPLLPEVADNILIQRLVAGHPDFTPLEALASVGLGMEWGVPEFFSLLLGGVIRFAEREQHPLTRKHLFVFIAHVQYDVLHAIAVMLVTTLLIEEEAEKQAVEQIKNAVNMLMTGRYAMMSGLYRAVFQQPCVAPGEAGLAQHYRVHDPRIHHALLAARRQLGASGLVTEAKYRDSSATPFDYWLPA